MQTALILLMLVAVVSAVAMFVRRAAMRDRLAVERKKAALRASFDTLSFHTPVGVVRGDTLVVVKIAHAPGQEAPYYGGLSSRNAGHWDAFWYVVGPGPSYFLVVCMVDTTRRIEPPRWTIRPLDEARMRAALLDDPAAQALAFGSAIRA